MLPLIWLYDTLRMQRLKHELIPSCSSDVRQTMLLELVKIYELSLSISRNYLKSKLVRHDSAEDPMAAEYDALEYRNSTACGFLDAFGYNGSLLLSKIDRKPPRVTEQQTLTRPAIIDKAKALAGAVTHGQQFKVTGRHHLTSNDFFIADALGKLEKEQKAMTAERRARQK
jgi:hypothetical protein